MKMVMNAFYTSSCTQYESEHSNNKVEIKALNMRVSPHRM